MGKTALKVGNKSLGGSGWAAGAPWGCAWPGDAETLFCKSGCPKRLRMRRRAGVAARGRYLLKTQTLVLGKAWMGIEPGKPDSCGALSVVPRSPCRDPPQLCWERPPCPCSPSAGTSRPAPPCAARGAAAPPVPLVPLCPQRGPQRGGNG